MIAKLVGRKIYVNFKMLRQTGKSEYFHMKFIYLSCHINYGLYVGFLAFWYLKRGVLC